MTDINIPTGVSETPNHQNQEVLDATGSPLQTGAIEAAVHTLQPISGEEALNAQPTEKVEQSGRFIARILRSIRNAPSKVKQGAEAFASDPLEYSKRAAYGSLIAFEAGPFSGPPKYTLAAYIQYRTGNPLISGAVLGAGTGTVELSAGMAAAEMLDKPGKSKARNLVERTLNRVSKVFKKDKFPVNPATEAIVANYLGTPAVLALKQNENPERTKSQNRKHAVIVAGLLTLAQTVQGVLIAEGVTNVTDPKVVVPAAATLVGIAYGGSKLKSKIESNAEVRPRFDLDQKELDELEKDFVKELKTKTNSDFCATWVSPKSRYANFLRTHEAKYFPEVGNVDSYYDDRQTYLALVDLRGGGKVVHGASFMYYDNTLSEEDNKTGLYTVDSLIERGNFTKEEFITYYQAQGINVSSAPCVETNFKIGDKPEDYWGLGTADLAYLTLLNHFIDNGLPISDSVVFATINKLQATSLARAGIRSSSLMGRTEFKTEEDELGKDSKPVAIDFGSAYDALAPLGMKLKEVAFS